jgi:hypothetical protein
MVLMVLMVLTVLLVLMMSMDPPVREDSRTGGSLA